MTPSKKVVLAVVVAAFAAFVGHVYLRLQRLMLANREVPVKHLNCHYLQNIEYGAEDITILKDGLAFLSTGLKFPVIPSFSDDPGKLFVMDLLHPKPTPVELQIKGELDLTSFNPHGISVYVDEAAKDGNIKVRCTLCAGDKVLSAFKNTTSNLKRADDAIYLFVVNHPQHKSQVEIFRFVEDNTLIHLKTITHPLLHSLNDVLAVGVESFYATNHQYFLNDVLHILAVIVGLPWCDVVYYSPQEVRVATSGIMGSNGINISPDKRYIYVSDIIDHEIEVFERKEGEQLVFMKSVDVGSLCDNIEVDHKTGDLWLGCHPNSNKLANYNPKDPPGSEIIKVQNILTEQPVVSQEYTDDGRVIMASTVAAPYEGKLLIGTAFHKALICSLK